MPETTATTATTDHAAALRAKIDDHSALIGIIGLGYVGLPLAFAFAEKGFRVLGFDVDPAKPEMIRNGQCYIQHLDCRRLERAVSQGLLEATTDFSRLGEPDCILICVPTPLTPQREPDMRYVESSARQIAPALRPGQLVVLESTTYPGTTDELVRSILEGAGDGSDRPVLGETYFLAFSPEREDPGNPSYGTTNTPKVVGGVGQVSGDLAEALYTQVIEKVVRVSAARTAEAAKLTENIFRAVNIALVNELKMVYDRMGIDVWEVLDAAATKPFGFMRFNPGPGWGGHCLDGGEWVRVRGLGLSGVYRFSELFEQLEPRCRALTSPGGHYLRCKGLEALAIDPGSGEIGWFPVQVLYRGRFEGEGCEVQTSGHRTLRVTDEHPMLVMSDDGLQVRAARDLEPGDRVPVVSDLGSAADDPVIDLLDIVPEARRTSVWVRRPGRPLSSFEVPLKRHFGWTIRDAIRSDALRLDRFLEIEPELGLDRSELVLLTGMGRSRRSWPSTLRLTRDFCRFVGYYLAEGCITEEAHALRVRLTFNRDESEYLADVTTILESAGFPVTRYDDRTWHTTTLKVSSMLLSWLLDQHWRSGRRSEDMRVPDQIFGLSPGHKRELLAGLLRGDGDAWTRSGLSRYRKNGKTYQHRNTTAVVGYFSSSPVLLEQVTHLLQDLGYFPRFKAGAPQLRLQGAATVSRLEPLFLGAKRDRLVEARRRRARTAPSSSDAPCEAPGLRLAPVDRVRPIKLSGWVYSMEVAGASTFVTSTGIAVHNCIPLDPFYLAWKARESGATTRFIELAGEVNVRMPEYVVEKLMLALNDHRKAIKGSKILVLGLAYKKDIDDPRESPAFELIEKLLALGAEVSYHDPHIPEAPRMRTWPDLPPMHSVDLGGDLAGYDAALLVTDHSKVDYAHLLEALPLIVDTRGVYREAHPKVVKA